MNYLIILRNLLLRKGFYTYLAGYNNILGAGKSNTDFFFIETDTIYCLTRDSLTKTILHLRVSLFIVFSGFKIFKLFL